MKRTHWTEFLPEAGTIATTRQQIDSYNNRIAEHQRIIEGLELERQRIEDRAFDQARQYWSIEEITAAKEAAKQAANTN